MSNMEDRIRNERERIDRASLAKSAGELAVSSEEKKKDLFNAFQNDGIDLKDAFFLTRDSRYKIAGLVSSFTKAGIDTERIPRGLKVTLFRTIKETDFVEGWKVSFPKEEKTTKGNDYEGRMVDATEALVVTPDYRIYSHRSLTLNNLDSIPLKPEEFQVPDDVVKLMAERRIEWVEPDANIYDS